MNVTINGNQQDVAAGTTVAALVERLGLGPKGVAVAVNEAVVPRSTWDAVELRDGDRAEVLIAAQGG
jgi:sulfur carrier protein